MNAHCMKRNLALLSLLGSLLGASVQAAAAETKVIVTADLLTPGPKAITKSATVEVMVTGFELVDPDMTSGKPVKGQGHLHYQLDGGVIVATTATKLSFHNLSPGTHRITVTPAGNNHKPVGPQQDITVTIPN